MRALALCLLLLAAPASAGKDGPATPATAPARHPCLLALDRLRVPYREAQPRKGIAIPVEVTGPIAGVTYTTWDDRPLVLDCSLVYSLARAGRFFTDAGITDAFYSSAYQRRNVRGTNRPSKHSYGLAIDLHRFSGPTVNEITVADDYEQGLGDEIDCVGAPTTVASATLRLLWCRLDRSGLFHHILGPDFDADHFDHFHVEALRWTERTDVSGSP